MTNTITAGAAVAAALFSILNVVLAGRFARGTQVQQWRRESARKAFAALLDAAREALEAKGELARRFEPRLKAQRRASSGDLPDAFVQAGIRMEDEEDGEAVIRAAKSIETLLYRMEELELIGSARCVAAAQALVDTVDRGMPRTVTDDDGVEGKLETFGAQLDVYGSARRAFVLACRRDLGVGRGRWREIA